MQVPFVPELTPQRDRSQSRRMDRRGRETPDACAEIRRRFLNFFAERGHTVVPSASLLLNDPTLLFVNAGMVPFKPYFLGEAVPPYKRATSVQKVVRTLDIEEVGKTTRHASFFQMCGNFSFGDYFKEGAIDLAWGLLTSPQSEGGYGLDGDRIWVTIWENDDVSYDSWTKTIGGLRTILYRPGRMPSPASKVVNSNSPVSPVFPHAGRPLLSAMNVTLKWASERMIHSSRAATKARTSCRRRFRSSMT